MSNRDHISEKIINPKHSRLSVTYIFFICGLLSGNWVVRIPELQQQYSLTKGDLGLVLTGGPIGSILIMLFVGNLISKYSSKNMTILGTLGFHILLPMIFLMPNPFIIWVYLACIGISTTIMDVSMNSQGIEVEHKLKTSAMSSFHAFFSIGNVFGAILGSIFIELGFNPIEHFFIISIVFLPISLISFKFLRNERLPKVSTKQNSFTIQLPPKEVWVIGLIAFFAVIGEMMIGDWGSIYVITSTGVTTSIAAFGYATFAVCMTIGRLSGDILSNRFPNDRIVKVFAIIGAIGMLVVISTTDLLFIIFGFALFGIGLSILIPTVFKVAGKNAGTEIGTGIAGVALFAYSAGIVEPVFIGQMAELFSLKIAFLLVGVLIAMIYFMAINLKPKEN